MSQDGLMAAPARRASCRACLRPQSACICTWIRPTPNDVDVLILQHPLEQSQAKGSAKLLELSLTHCTMLVGDTFEPVALANRLTQVAPDGRPAHAVLLYPESAASTLPRPPAGDNHVAAAPDAPLRLVVIDGTWRKSLKMLHSHPILQTLPRMAITQATASPYATLRKAPKPGQLSTLEATCLALSALEANAQRYTPLLEAFAGFVLAANRSSSERQTTRLRPPPLAS